MKVLEINKEDLKSNLNIIKNLISEKSPNTKTIIVVKANGMGLDLIKYSKFLVENGIENLAVANSEEAICLREAGINQNILMLTPLIDKNELQLLIQNDITITIGSFNDFEIAEKLAKENGKKVNAHIKIDTGFGRYGFLSEEKEIILEVFKKCENINITGMFTHFSDPKSEEFTRNQFLKFQNIVDYIKENGSETGMLHVASSTAFLKYPDMWLDAVRIGSVVQGRTLVDIKGLKKIGKFKSNIQEIKELPKGYNISYRNTYKTKDKTQVAIVPVGYVDGFNKNKLRDDFSFKNNLIAIGMEIKKIFKDNSLKVKIKGKECRVIGKIGMFHSIVDITNLTDVQIGEEVEIDIAPLQANDIIRREYI